MVRDRPRVHTRLRWPGGELGWRGYALPRLLARFTPLGASLVLGVLWAAWHLPFALTLGSALDGIPLYWFLPSLMGASILYTWVFNGTGGSVLLAILFHAASNTTANVVATGNLTMASSRSHWCGPWPSSSRVRERSGVVPLVGRHEHGSHRACERPPSGDAAGVGPPGDIGRR